MSPRVKHLPNLFSGMRLAMLPVLWALALQGRTLAVGIGLLLAGATDVIDGQLARRLDAVTPFGAQLDSLADNLLVPSAAVWLAMLRPDVVAEFLLPLGLWLALYLTFLLVGMVKFRRFGNLHLYSGKAAALCDYAFILHCLLFPGIPAPLFYLAFGLSVLSLLEGLAYELIFERVHEHAGSLLLVLLRRPEQAR